MAKRKTSKPQKNEKNDDSKNTKRRSKASSENFGLNYIDTSYEKIKDLKDIGGKSVTKKNTEYNSLVESWMDFTNRMNSQFMENMREQQNEYERMYGNWMNMSGIVTNELTKNMQDDETNYQELYNVWKNYANKIGSQLAMMQAGSSAVVSTTKGSEMPSTPM